MLYSDEEEYGLTEDEVLDPSIYDAPIRPGSCPRAV